MNSGICLEFACQNISESHLIITRDKYKNNNLKVSELALLKMVIFLRGYFGLELCRKNILKV